MRRFRLQDLPIHTKLVTAVCFLVIGLISGVTLTVERAERGAIIEQVRKQAVVLASNVAAMSTNALLAYNYVRLEQIAARLSREEDVLYVIILDREGRVAAHSVRNGLEESLPEDPGSLQAAAASRVVVRKAVLPGTGDPLYDVAAPVYIRESPEKWGTVRVGISLRPMGRALARIRLDLILLGLAAIALGGIGALFLARRITLPIGRLVDGAVEVGKGNLSFKIPLTSRDEIGTLATTFNEMTDNLQTGRRALESAHRELKEGYREISLFKEYNDSILKSMTSGVLTLDLDGRIATANDAALQITGRSACEVVGKLCSTVFPESPELNAGLLAVLRREERKIQVLPLRYPRPDGKTLFLELTAAGLKDETGTLIGVLGVLRDLTHEQELEEQLRRADRLAALGTMAAGIAHEIKNPLTALRTFSRLLPQRPEDPAFLKKFAEIVPHELDRINFLVEDLMELARPTQMRLRPGDVGGLIERALKTHAEALTSRGIEFHFRPTLHPESLLIDPEHLYRALTNLVLNAIEAMPRGGVLDIRTETQAAPQGKQGARSLVIHVQDTGEGIPADRLGDLFTPFFTTKPKGTGLGLAITHKIVEGHGGRIRVESRVGQGTRFSVFLPLNHSSNRLPAPPPLPRTS